MSDQHQEERLRRWAREQADIERQIDALVVAALSSMVNAAADLKSRLKRDADAILDEYRRTKRGLENDISLSTAERLRLRREAEHESDAILSEARERARVIVQAAEGERDTMLAEVRSMEQRMRGLEGQIRTALGLGEPQPNPAPADQTIVSANEGSELQPPVVAETPARLAAADLPAPLSAPHASERAVDAQADDDKVDGDRADLPPFLRLVPGRADEARIPAAPPAPSNPAHSPEVAATYAALTAALAAVRKPANEPDAGPDIAPSRQVRPAAVSDAAAAQPSPSSPGARPPERASGPRVPDAYRAASRPSPASASPRPEPVSLVFSGVPSYHQASIIEMAIGDLLPDADVDIVEFEGGNLELSVRVSNVRELAEQIVAAAPATLALDAVTDGRATFRCL